MDRISIRVTLLSNIPAQPHCIITMMGLGPQGNSAITISGIRVRYHNVVECCAEVLRLLGKLVDSCKESVNWQTKGHPSLTLTISSCRHAYPSYTIPKIYTTSQSTITCQAPSESYNHSFNRTITSTTYLSLLLGLHIQVSTEKQRCVSMKSCKQASGSSNEMYRHLVLEMYRHLVLWHSLSYLYRIFSFGQGNLAHVAFFRVLG